MPPGDPFEFTHQIIVAEKEQPYYVAETNGSDSIIPKLQQPALRAPARRAQTRR